MFSFFSKKKYLVDYLEGFVDIHNHILPGIDDGAKNVEESIALLKAFAEFGVRDFICTPHIMENYYPNTPKTINKSLAVLENGLKMSNLNGFNIRVAAEHMIDSNFESILEEKKTMPLANNYLLIEMSYLQPSLNLLDSVEKIALKKYYPILAHPERYVFLHEKKSTYSIYRKKGLLMQLNLLSLSEYYGKNVQKAAFELLQSGHIDFLATDIHNKRQLKALNEIKLNTKVLNQIVPIIEKTTFNFR
ncbi:histidinol phosphatase [Maribacter sp. 4U21]|uniref:tyrosine-protein phosphatase n=1 Tax=Maribacter sp. 4U21 TaxID=1889779 RepID=UPI000C14794C|nr:CpsB/CapC family capsule biosynthesis tyrosine phosphatase [Maribacter sp. 4U21]PIB25512.1 histidinol phosphatase [Maribacter sp. 4U21]